MKNVLFLLFIPREFRRWISVLCFNSNLTISTFLPYRKYIIFGPNSALLSFFANPIQQRKIPGVVGHLLKKNACQLELVVIVKHDFPRTKKYSRFADRDSSSKKT